MYRVTTCLTWPETTQIGPNDQLYLSVETINSTSHDNMAQLSSLAHLSMTHITMGIFMFSIQLLKTVIMNYLQLTLCAKPTIFNFISS